MGEWGFGRARRAPRAQERCSGRKAESRSAVQGSPGCNHWCCCWRPLPDRPASAAAQGAAGSKMRPGYEGPSSMWRRPWGQWLEVEGLVGIAAHPGGGDGAATPSVAFCGWPASSPSWTRRRGTATRAMSPSTPTGNHHCHRGVRRLQSARARSPLSGSAGTARRAQRSSASARTLDAPQAWRTPSAGPRPPPRSPRLRPPRRRDQLRPHQCPARSGLSPGSPKRALLTSHPMSPPEAGPLYRARCELPWNRNSTRNATQRPASRPRRRRAD